MDRGSSEFLDMWILSTREKDQKLLTELASSDKRKCCWNGGLEKYLHGFVRVIWYKDGKMNGNEPEYINRIFEGRAFENNA